MIDLHLSAFAPRWRFLYVVRIDAYFSPISSVTQRSIADTVSLVLTGTRVSFSEFKAIAATESSELTNIFIHRKT